MDVLYSSYIVVDERKGRRDRMLLFATCIVQRALLIQNYRRDQSHNIASTTLSASESTSDTVVTHLDQAHDFYNPRFQVKYLFLPYAHADFLLTQISDVSGPVK